MAIPAVITSFTYSSIALIWVTYGLWLTIEFGVVTFVIFLTQWYRGKHTSFVTTYELPRLRVAALVSVYNEDPDVVKRTVISVKNAVDSFGGVFLLDDSTDEQIIVTNRRFCRSNDVTYVHRKERRGYKAGAINDAIKKFGGSYDVIAIFDADQRPVTSFFNVLLPFFSDKRIAVVQVPQRYSNLTSRVAKGSNYEQKGFYDVVMKGRNATGSAFILGSGSIIRIAALRDVGYFDEKTVTEDVATSVRLHSKNYRSVYVDYPGIWYGEAPRTLTAYLIQHGRWALGGFQLIGTLVRSDISFRQFVDYFAGVMYWVQQGPLALVEMSAPIIFLLGRLPMLNINPILFLFGYYPFFFFSMGTFMLLMDKDEYGAVGFAYQQSIETTAMPVITQSFIAWLLRKKRPFKVTPKTAGGGGKIEYFGAWLYIALFVELAAFVSGLGWFYSTSDTTLRASLIINLGWAAYFTILLIGSITLLFSSEEEKQDVLITNTEAGPYTSYSYLIKREQQRFRGSQ